MQKQKVKYNRIGSIFAMLLMMGMVLTGCQKINRDTRIVLTTGFTEDEVFRIDSASCYKKEFMVYLTNMKNQYEKVYGEDIWDKDTLGADIEMDIKESAQNQLAQIKTMNLMAENYGLSLDEEMQEKIAKAADVYFESLSDKEKTVLDVNHDTIVQMYTEYAMADQVYAYIIQNINPEISDDEARRVTLQQILIKTSKTDENGLVLPYTQEEKNEAYLKAAQVIGELNQGEEFEMLVSRYNEADEGTISIGKGDTNSDFEKVAFDLGQDEVSTIFEMPEGYYILKCVSTNNQEETDANKIRIVEARRKEAFEQEYDGFVQGLTRNRNSDLWEEIGFIEDDDITTDSFFSTYQEIMK